MQESNESTETSLCMLGNVLRFHICRLNSVRFCLIDNILSELVCEVSKKLNDFEQRSVKIFLSKEGKNANEIHESMVAVYGESVPS